MPKRAAKTISIFQVSEMFSTEDNAVAWYEKYRWEGKTRCPRCNKTDKVAKDSRKYHYRCNRCIKRFTVKVGTVMESSKIPVRKWLLAMYLCMTARKGISSLQLSKELGITQKSAWYMAHRIREACKAEMPKLSGEVEIDETYIGGLEKNKHHDKRLSRGRGTVGKSAVIGMRERGGRVKAMPMRTVDKPSTHKVVADNVETGSQLYTDDASHWTKGVDGYKHESVNHSAKEFVYGMAHTNGIESVWAVLKRGYNGTYHQFSSKHLARYVNEFSFRLNEGRCEIDTIDRIASMVKATDGKRIKYHELIK